ncbi:hypothetical protein [Cellulomonas dongxiuzhuiae]|uniref:Secreted protein n=1 Tax=Cellulomonas dongxiuzhuiae TaxID=2819979 RepID=A0ABX8GEZ2_9CELL|nr:hypothetical protein [Cellulomonas dongxiuzhuiae]MBO3087216.1 hypothetical protein [Cellulomonas dongxiuzhuiae]MBO3093387.1 hypothetical protein [Cellulomonas dongxiuzhuiae]QWC14535.1 hypothetical protein KKR89_08980 [Cellulomonas dongxiuzhuiae]
MRRLFWVGVGVALTVVVVRQGRRLVAQYAPAGTGDAVDGAVRVGRALRAARDDFRTGVAEREAELLEALVGDVDIDTVRANAPRHRAELRETFGRPAQDGLARDLSARGWADEPLTDPDDDAQAPFF